MTIKNPTTWLPQPIGYGYNQNVASQNLSLAVAQGGGILSLSVAQGSGKLSTGTNRIVGRFPTVWSNTGS